MKRRYHIPARVGWNTELPAQDRVRIEGVTLSAIRRAVESYGVGEVYADYLTQNTLMTSETESPLALGEVTASRQGNSVELQRAAVSRQPRFLGSELAVRVVPAAWVHPVEPTSIVGMTSAETPMTLAVPAGESVGVRPSVTVPAETLPAERQETINLDGIELSPSPSAMRALLEAGYAANGPDWLSDLLEQVEKRVQDDENAVSVSGGTPESLLEAEKRLPLEREILRVLQEQIALLNVEIQRLQSLFRSDVTNMAFGYLYRNRELVMQEMVRLGMPQSRPSAPSTQPALEKLQIEAAKVAKLQGAQRQLQQVQVGHEWVLTGPRAAERRPTYFDPHRRPPIEPTGNEDPKLATWDEVNDRYVALTQVIAIFANRYPAIYALIREGKVGEFARRGPQEARVVVYTVLRNLLLKIDEVAVKLETEDIDPLDLKPIHDKLLRDAPAASGIAWNQPFNKRVAEELLADHKFREFWKDLGLTTLAAVAFIVAELATAGTATFFIAGGIGLLAGGLQVAMSWEQYLDLAAAASANVSDELAIVSKEDILAKEMEAVLNSVFFFLDAFGPAARLAKKGVGKAAEEMAKREIAAGAKELAEREAVVGATKELAGHEAVSTMILKRMRELAGQHPALKEILSDPQAVLRLLSKGTNVNHVKGQLLEEILERRVRAMLGSEAGRAALGLKQVAGELEFIPGHLIRDNLGQLTDGIIAIRKGDKLQIVIAFEAKAGESAKAGLRWERKSLSELNKAEREELAHHAVELLREQRKLPPPTIMSSTEIQKQFPKELDEIMRKELSQKELGQVTKDIERLVPVHGEESTTILVNGVETEVVATPKTTTVIGALPSDVKPGRLVKDLRELGYGFDILPVDVMARELEAAATSIAGLFTPAPGVSPKTLPLAPLLAGEEEK